MGKKGVNNISNSRICIVIPGSIFSTPYLKRYVSLLESLKVKYDLILWRGKDIKEKSNAYKEYVFSNEVLPTSSKWKKLYKYILFLRFANNILRRNNYEKIFVMTGNMAVLLYKVLLSKYCTRYLVDIRDYYLEHYKIYYYLEKKIIDNSGITIISSKGYKNFLPEHEYTIAHNYSPITKTSINKKRSGNGKIVMSYIGNMRFVEQDRKMLKLFCNDVRYEIRLNGKGYGMLRNYCNEIGMKNVSIVDYFDPDDTFLFYQETDIVLNLYGNHTPLLDYALSNKLYFAAQFYKPILVCKDTYMSEISCQYGFGFEFDLDHPENKDSLYEWYQKIDWSQFVKGCDYFIEEVKKEDKIFEKNVTNFIQGIR